MSVPSVELDMWNRDDDGIVVDPLSTDAATTIHVPPVRGRGFRHTLVTGYSRLMRFEKVWIEQCHATKAIKRRFGANSALDYLVGEKLMSFADAARDHPGFAKELPRFLAAIWQTFNEYEIAGYVASRKPTARKRLRQLLYLR